jgi:cytochrome c553
MTPRETMTRSRSLLALAVLLALGARAEAQETPEKAALCAACHGEAGVPVNPETPILWGQNAGYIYVQLRDFKAGNRRNPQMSPVAEMLDKQEMKDLAMYFADKPWPDLGQPQVPRDVAERAETVSESANCKGCHLDTWRGDSTTPRLAGQSIAYLRATMTALRDGERTNNPSMAALLKTYRNGDIEAVARYLAAQ